MAEQDDLEAQVAAIGRDLYSLSGSSPPAFFSRRLVGQVMALALEDEAFRTRLFRFIANLPHLRSDAALSHHYSALVRDVRLDHWVTNLLPLGRHASLAPLVRWLAGRMGRYFMVENQPAVVAKTLHRLHRQGRLGVIDVVGEAVLSEAGADRYIDQYLALLEGEAAWEGRRPAFAIKLSALVAHFDPLNPEGVQAAVLGRLARLMPAVIRTGAVLTVDMEQNEYRPLILGIFRSLVAHWPDRRWLPGIALQAYLPDCRSDLETLIRFAREAGRPLAVRLVKGAYWDTEVIQAAQRGWPCPVFQDKAATDANFETLTHLLFANHDAVVPLIASHNLRSVSVALAAARAHALSPTQYEIQMLYGMAEPLGRALAAGGVPVRVYLPAGNLLEGMAYLMRRLLENTAQTSFLRQAYAERQDLADLLRPPRPAARPAPAPDTTPPYRLAPDTDFSDPKAVAVQQQALDAARQATGRRFGHIQGGAGGGLPAIVSQNPARPHEILGYVGQADIAEAEAAVARAVAAEAAWAAAGTSHRCAVIRELGRLIAQNRQRLAAWLILEAGKTWRDADAEVSEAVDFCHYYAWQAEQLGGWHETYPYPGERNHLRYQPRGATVVISPWNFPLAILTGMSVAALVTGNPAILKPSAQTPLVAVLLHELMLQAGLPADVVQLLPGSGARIGHYLVAHPETKTIAFTGSREVGLSILALAHSAAASSRHIKQVVCELGGKNAILVDEDADLDEAITPILSSAFGYAGQKCSAASRLITVGGVGEPLLERLGAAMLTWRPADPSLPGSLVGPLINAAARQRAQAYYDRGCKEGRLVLQVPAPVTGHFWGPTLFAGILPESPLARDEIFAPILSQISAGSFEEALALANGSAYALTGGVFSQNETHLALAREHFRAGNLYLNRKITGALVGVQPFGGFGLSGTGIQAGGPDYLLQFVICRVVSENLLRHGSNLGGPLPGAAC